MFPIQDRIDNRGDCLAANCAIFANNITFAGAALWPNVCLHIYLISMKRLITKLLFLCLYGLAASAQQFEFSHLSNSDGLSNNQVECIFRDSRGFLWIGTNVGLDRYDGARFKTYKHIKNKGNSPMHDRVIGIGEDMDGNLWLQASSYMLYDWRSESFCNNTDSVLNAMGLPSSPVCIEIDKDKNFFAAYAGLGVHKYDIRTNEVTVYPQSESPDGLDLSEIAHLKVKGRFAWVLHKNGVLERLNTETGRVDIRNTFFRENLQNSTIRKSIFIDSDDEVWIFPSINDKGTACLDLKQNRWRLLDTNAKAALSNDFVRCVGQDSKGLIWIGTDHGGVNIFDKEKNTIEVVENNIYNENSISQNSIISIFCEEEGSVWVGTYKKGISYYHPNLFKFKKSPLFYTFNRNAEDFDCNSLYKDRKNNLWIGTNGKGLVKYNMETGESRRFRNNPRDPGTISADIITSIFEDHSQTLWVGTFLGGMNAYDGKVFRRYQVNEKDSNSLASKSVYGLAEDNDNNLWIATLGGGLNKLHTDRKTFTRYHTGNSALHSDYILSVFTDRSKNIYLSSDRGINYIDHYKKEITGYFPEESYPDSLTTVCVNYQMMDSRGLLWIATDRGINIYNPFFRRFTCITTENGLPSDEVVSLVEDNEGNVWAGTRNGLACVYCDYTHPDLRYHIVFFNANDGLPGSVCNPNAIFKDREGVIYVGGTEGYVAFNPKEIVFNEQVPKPRFTDMLITNQVIEPNVEYNGRVIMERSITDLDEMTLKYGETNFTVLFSSMNFIHPAKNKYRYMLEGLDSKWTEVSGGAGSASYSNLNPGKYKLLVYASNNDNAWTTEPIALKITVDPPFWLSWWAYIVYAMIVAALIRGFLKYKLNKQREKYEQAQKILEADKLHELDELKFKFFTNISHEFKTPLTLILTPLEKLIKSPVYENHKTMLDIMYKNAHSLLDMVTEILDFRRFDQQKQISLNLSRGNIIEFAKEICRPFSSLSAEKCIKLTFTTYLQELQMDFDGEKMNKIIANLISNAFKYTEEGQINVSIGIQESFQGEGNPPAKQMILRVSDTGIGIEPEHLDRLFERFYRVDNPDRNNRPGTGVGLHLASEYVKLHGGEIQVESVVGKGSVFTVALPVQNLTIKELKQQEVFRSETFDEDFSLTEAVAKPEQSQRTNLPLLLIVDDNEDFCQFIADLFISDYRIVTANDGEEGCKVVFDQLPEIILCDVMMPRMDGYEFCRKVKGDIRTSHIPVILLTAKSSEENKYSGIESGADDYISKPFNIDMLKLKIAKIIEKQKRLQSNFRKKIDVSPSDIQITSMDEKFVQKAVSVVEANMGNPDFLVEDLCREMGMSRVYFYKKTLALTDKTPSEFIRFIRLKRAADLLEKSQQFVNEIAFQVGFNDPKYFRKYFKEEFGMTPNEYKKKVPG